MNKVIFLSLSLIMFGNFSFSQNTYDFLRLDGSARAGALVGSFVSNNDDADVIFYNPAGIKLLDGNPASFSFVKHLLDINLASLSYSTEFEDIGRFGAAIKYINYGSFDEVDAASQSTDENAYHIALKNADNLVYHLWQDIQAESYGYTPENTTMFITNDHGRHDGDAWEVMEMVARDAHT